MRGKRKSGCAFLRQQLNGTRRKLQKCRVDDHKQVRLKVPNQAGEVFRRRPTGDQKCTPGCFTNGLMDARCQMIDQVKPRNVVMTKLGSNAEEADALLIREQGGKIRQQFAHSSISKLSREKVASNTSLEKLRHFFGQVSTHWQQNTHRPRLR